jgi:hypothetical protein
VVHVLNFFTFLVAKYFGINIPSAGEYPKTDKFNEKGEI